MHIIEGIDASLTPTATKGNNTVIFLLKGLRGEAKQGTRYALDSHSIGTADTHKMAGVHTFRRHTQNYTMRTDLAKKGAKGVVRGRIRVYCTVSNEVPTVRT